MKLDKVTLTGADDTIPVESLVELSHEFPFVEFGILFSLRNTQSIPGHRWPSQKWLEDLRRHAECNPLKLSAHLCGRMFVRELVERGEFNFMRSYPELFRHFQRIQINTHAEPHKHCAMFDQHVLDSPEKEFILQVDGVNNAWQEQMMKDVPNTVPLFDESHGAGVLPSKWPSSVPGKYCGYAGGLGPGDFLNQMTHVEAAAGEARVWADMETKIRSDKDDSFDLEKCRQVLNAASILITK